MFHEVSNLDRQPQSIILDPLFCPHICGNSGNLVHGRNRYVAPLNLFPQRHVQTRLSDFPSRNSQYQTIDPSGSSAARTLPSSSLINAPTSILGTEIIFFNNAHQNVYQTKFSRLVVNGQIDGDLLLLPVFIWPIKFEIRLMQTNCRNHDLF